MKPTPLECCEYLEGQGFTNLMFNLFNRARGSLLQARFNRSCESISDGIVYGFTWVYTQQGGPYWSELRIQLRNNVTNPI